MGQETQQRIASAPRPQARRVAAARRHQRAGPSASWSWIVPSDAYRVALWLLLLLSISRLHQHFGFLSALRPAMLATLAAMLLAVLRSSTLATVNLKAFPMRVTIALAALGCLSVPFSLSVGNSGRFMLEAYLRVIVVYVLVCLALRGPKQLSQFTWVFVVSCGILSWMATFVFQATMAGGVQRLGDLYMYDSNDLGVLLVMGIPLTMVAFEASGRKGRIAAVIIALWMGLALAKTGSRGAFVGLAALVPAFLFWARHIRIHKRLVAIGAIIGALLVAAPFGYWDQMQSLLHPTEDYNWSAESGRRKVALRGLKYMWTHPLTGVGVDNFSKAEWEISAMALDQSRDGGIKGSAAHNTWIQAGAEMGVPGMILYLALVFGTMTSVIKIHRRVPSEWRGGTREQRLLFALGAYLPLSILGYAVTCTFVSFAYMDPMYFLAALSAGYIVIVRRAHLQTRPPLRPA